MFSCVLTAMPRNTDSAMPYATQHLFLSLGMLCHDAKALAMLCCDAGHSDDDGVTNM